MSDDTTRERSDPVVRFARRSGSSRRRPRRIRLALQERLRDTATDPDARINGVDVAEIGLLIGAALAAPDGARANWRVVTTWEPGPEGAWGHSHSRHDVDGRDEDDGDRTPQEQLLGVANTCVIVGLRVRAAREGLRLDAIEVTASADSDLRELVGLPTSTPGFRALDIRVATRGDGSAERREALVREVLAASPILACLRQPVDVSSGPIT